MTPQQFDKLTDHAMACSICMPVGIVMTEPKIFRIVCQTSLKLYLQWARSSDSMFYSTLFDL